MPIQSVTVKISDEALAAIRERAKGEDSTVTGVLSPVIEQWALTDHPLEGSGLPVVMAVPPRPPTLDEACAVILGAIRPEQAELIQAVAAEHDLRPSHYILSYCKLADERGETSTMIDDRVRYDRDAAGPTTLPESLSGPTACKECGALFTPTRRGQTFCPDPDNGQPSCGRRYSLRELIHPARPRTLRDAEARAAAPPSPVGRLTGTEAQTADEMASLRGELAELKAMLRQVVTNAQAPAGSHG